MFQTPVKILLVEDSPSDAALLREGLPHNGAHQFHVTTVARMAEALACLRGESYDVVLLDLSLPDSTGIETLSHVQDAAPHLPIVVLTGADDERIGMEAVRRGVQDYLIKGQVEGRLVARSIRYAIERKRAQQEREITIEFLRRVNASTGVHDLIEMTATFFHQRSGCEAVGIRLKSGDDYPYFESRGFPSHFLETESRLCAQDAEGRPVLGSDGKPVLECMCGSVISGRFDPSKPFYTERGSYWTGSTTDVLAATKEEDQQARMRNQCNREGYESVALIPLRCGSDRLGLLQLNDRRRGCFSRETLSLWERLADNLGIALAKFQAEQALRQAHDELEQKVAERTEDLNRLTRTLEMIIDCNEAIVRASTEQELFDEVCRIIIDVGGYRMAWVGTAEDDQERTVRPVAAAGSETGYLSTVQITWAKDRYGRGPTGTAIRTGEVCIGTDFLTDPKLAPWREQALQHGFRSSIALPLAAAGRIFGALTIYSALPTRFDEEQARILHELAGDLAFGITALRTQTERNQARGAAEERAEQLRALALQLTQAEQVERRRLAKVLHDHLQQLLVCAKFSLSLLSRKARAKDDEQTMQQLSETIDEAIGAARSLTAELSPPLLHEKGLVAGLEWLSRQMMKKHGLKVEVQADGNAEPATEQMRLFLFESVRELLFNIVKHAKVASARVQLNRLGSGQIRITVADEGAGFEPQRLSGRVGLAGGFGLFSIRERLGYLGGSMEVDSAPGRGSRFTLVAPIRVPEGAPHRTEPRLVAAASARRAARTAPGSGLPTISGRKIRVLLADDHAVVRQGLAALLREEPDIEVAGQAGDGDRTVLLARQLRPDVVLMDVTMPGLSGIEATRLITAEMPEVRVIALSLHDDADMAASMRQAGARVYLSKAGPAEDLIAAIRAC
jgi:DNA-binding NarL/FixJ family response regulator/signal transduction histidine kinase